MSNLGMKDLIARVNQLQDAASTAGLSFGELDLPQIAVVGGQSAGKSSVLENFVGRDFLPRGSGIVTRRPLVLQLHTSKEEYAEFLHIEGEKFTNFDLIREEIEKETDRLTGKNKGISSVPINLRIYSPNVLELTLVDLPGMTRVPVGDQPVDIEDQIRNMILEYIASDNTLILAVSPANQDIANSDALKLSHLVDPEGERTIGVLTKLDLMDKGTDAKDILDNKVYRLQRGFVGLVNRSQQDINNRKNLEDSLKDEMDFFYTHETYRDIADRMGSKYLQNVLNKELSEHIHKKLPKLTVNIKKKHAALKEKLTEMNAFNDMSDSEKQLQLMKSMYTFCEDLNTDLTGYTLDVEGERLNTGAKINDCFYKDIYNILHQAGCPNEKELETIVQNIHGFRNGHFICGLSLEIVVRKLIKRYYDPIDVSIDLISTLLLSSIKECSKKLNNFPKLKGVVIEILSKRIKTQEEETKNHLKMYLDAQTAFINTKHPHFNEPKRFRLPILEQNQEMECSNNLEENEPVQKIVLMPGAGLNGLSAGAKILQKSWISICGSSITWSKTCWFVLTTETLTWYKDDYETEQLGMIPVQGLILAKHPEYKGFAISRDGGEPVNDDYQKMILVFQTDRDLSQWHSAWNRIGIAISIAPEDMRSEETLDKNSKLKKKRIKRNKNKQDNQETQDAESVDSPEQGIKVLIKMIESYMKIVDQSTLDIIPKYTILLLIESTLKFSRISLLHEILIHKDRLNFMDESSEDVEKKNKLMAVYEATEKALEILKDAYFS